MVINNGNTSIAPKPVANFKPQAETGDVPQRHAHRPTTNPAVNHRTWEAVLKWARNRANVDGWVMFNLLEWCKNKYRHTCAVISTDSLSIHKFTTPLILR
jgi:hypothetical protein